MGSVENLCQTKQRVSRSLDHTNISWYISFMSTMIAYFSMIYANFIKIPKSLLK